MPEFLKPLMGLVETGGPVVMLLLCLSVVSLGLILAKLIQFSLLRVGKYRTASRALEAWHQGHGPQSLEIARGSRSVSAEIMRRLIFSSLHRGVDEALLREDIERFCAKSLARMRSLLRPLDLISQTAPLIGLFGTVLGMIEAFRAMQGAGAAVDPSVLAGGIWVALLTTAVGLAIAIPVSAVVGWFDGIIEREQSHIEEMVTAFFTGAVTEHPGGTVIPVGKLHAV